MCERCPGLIAELIAMDPKHLDESKATHVLWEHTAYPFSSFEHSAQQARDFVAAVVLSRLEKEQR